MWKLSIEDDQGNKTVVNLVRDEYSVGRAEHNTVRLTERNISRSHALIRKQGNAWTLEDLNSYNGCFVNGVRVGGQHALEHGDLIQLGDYRLELVDDAVAAAGLPDVGTGSRPATVPGIPRSQALLGQPDRLVMLVGPVPGTEFPLAGERLVIGRGEECDISINHGSVSRVHAEIRAVGNGRYELLDRDSANGLRINGVELKRALIDARDMIELGDVVLKFIPAGQIYRPGADESQQIGALSAYPDERLSSASGIEAHMASRGLPPAMIAVIGVCGLAVVLLIGVVALHGRGAAPTPSQDPGAASVDSAAHTLTEAKALLDKGEIESAHLKATTEIPADSNVRQSQDFRDIEARWADSLLQQANQEPDPAKKRAILERVDQATTVDAARRQRASDELEAMDTEAGVNVKQLPSAPVAVKEAPTTSGGLVRKNPFDETETHHTHATYHARNHAKSQSSAGSSNMLNAATSGNRAQQAQAKAYYKSKVANGTATARDRAILRGLCRELNDPSCL
jgi:pSer/pThr/pTyr-binding forkhead associated (FHA) protein